ncbi:MAG: hypothetical protein KatS3mg130_2020 [Candidatus Sumerlaea sp.]|nr:MAG: hypothetical protein KatS3mg130_2020 [Candidatus Sumerlaea sp.]
MLLAYKLIELTQSRPGFCMIRRNAEDTDVVRAGIFKLSCLFSRLCIRQELLDFLCLIASSATGSNTTELSKLRRIERNGRVVGIYGTELFERPFGSCNVFIQNRFVEPLGDWLDPSGALQALLLVRRHNFHNRSNFAAQLFSFPREVQESRPRSTDQLQLEHAF